MIFFKRFYLFIHKDTQREREAETQAEGEAGRLHAGSPMWDLIQGLQDHSLGQRQVLNRWATQGSPDLYF